MYLKKCPVYYITKGVSTRLGAPSHRVLLWCSWLTLWTLNPPPQVQVLVGAPPLLAQLVEQWTVVPFVTCSIQVERRRVPYIDSTIVNFFPIAQLVERATVNRKVIGSNPVGKVFYFYSVFSTL